jgi:sigma-B regulation protein RsbU (phosphoserine phosphatase)
MQGTGDAFYSALLDDDIAELYEHAPCGYLSLLPDGTIAKANATFLDWTGYGREDVLGRRRFADLLAPGDRIYYETHIAPMLAMQGRIREVAVELVLHTGERLPVIANAVVKTGDDGRPVVVRIALFDATERRSYERELLAARERADALARILQTSLLPPTIIQPPGLEIGASFRPSGDGSTVGGDFYDVFETGDGRVALVLGDVAGKGPAAAVLTSLARHTVRTEALRRTSPAPVLATIGEAFLQYHPDDFCTAVLVIVDPPPRTAARLATAGHHLPVLRRAHGAINRVGEPGQMLGLLEQPHIPETVIDLYGDDLIVLFTDGVVEARRDDEFFDDKRLVDIVEKMATKPAHDIADAIVAAALAFQGGGARDDIAVLVCRVRRGSSA